MTASTLSAAAEAGDGVVGGGVVGGGGWTALVDGGADGDVGDLDAEGVSVTRGVACGDEATVCGDEATVWCGVSRIDAESAPAALPVAI